MKLSEYLLDRIFSLIYMLVAALVLLALLWLIETPAVFILFAEVILLAAYSTALLYDFFRKQSFYNLLQKMTEQMDIKTLLGELLVPPHFLEGQILVDVLRCCNKYQNDQLACAEQENREYREYLDSWVYDARHEKRAYFPVVCRRNALCWHHCAGHRIAFGLFLFARVFFDCIAAFCNQS